MQQKFMRLNLLVNGHARTVDLPGVDQVDYDAAHALMTSSLGADGVKNRDAITDAFLYLLNNCPGANASDLWHHVVYRLYSNLLLQRGFSSPGQSWVRASGDALEIVLARWYAPDLIPYGIGIKALIGKIAKQEALRKMGLSATVGGSKLDVVLTARMLDGDEQIFGGVHVKASLAERVQDVPTSRAMMNSGYLSPLWTLDVKSFPPPQGNLVNRGELGSPTTPSDKRMYIEQHGDFDNCYSANSRTNPSVGSPPAGKRIYSLDLWRRPDQFAQDVIARAAQFRASADH